MHCSLTAPIGRTQLVMGVTLFISVLPASSPEHFMQMTQPYVQAKCIFNIQFSNGEIEKAKHFGILGII